MALRDRKNTLVACSYLFPKGYQPARLFIAGNWKIKIR